MARFDAMKEHYEEISLFGKPALFVDIRLMSETVPKGLHLYEVRHDDETWAYPVQIAKGILVNHYGSVITREPIRLPTNGKRDIDDEKDWKYVENGCRTIDEFMEKYPPVKQKDRER